jgi:CheY-like chemotaxis protein
VVVNASHQRRQQQKLNAIDRAGRELVRLDYESLRDRDASQRLSLLEDRIIRCSREVLNYQHFAVLLLDERSNRLEEVVSAGLDRDAPFQLFANTEGNGICGYVAATGRSYISSDVRSDPLYRPGLRSARSSLTVPLRLHDKVIGVLNVESDRAGAFCEEDRQFAEIFGNYVALALHILNLLVFERHSTHCRVSDSISSELAGPVNDIITEASAMVEDYIGDDALRSRLGGLIEQATQTRDAIQRLAEGGPTGTISRGDDGEDGDPAFAGKRVLVADDEEMIRHTIQDVLSGQGCEVEAVCDGAAAIRRLESGGYDLVISDIKMPQANGYEVFAAAKKHNPAAAVILVTGFGYDPGHSIVRANREGLSAVLFKPFKVKQLVEECRSALAGREA